MSQKVLIQTLCDPHQVGDNPKEVEGTSEVFLIDGELKYMDVCNDCATMPHADLADLADTYGVPEPPSVAGVRPVKAPQSKAPDKPREAECPFCHQKCRGVKGDLYSRGVKAHVRQNHVAEWEHYNKHGRWSNDRTAAAS